MILAVGTLSLLAFQGVRPVIRSISPRMRRVSCALKVGFVSGFPTVLVWVGAVPLPVPPLLGLPPLLPLLPRSGRLGNMVAGNLHPIIGTLRYTDEDFSADQSSGVDDRLVNLHQMLVRQDFLLTEYESICLQCVLERLTKVVVEVEMEVGLMVLLQFLD